MKNILVIGGAGYIGSHTCKNLYNSGYQPVVYDNLSRGNNWSVKWGPLIKGDISDENKIREVINQYQPEGIFHFAAYAYVGESTSNPRLYYTNNVKGTISVLNAMIDTKIKNIIFSSSCATYGLPQNIPIPIDHVQKPISPYGESKLIIEKILKDYNLAYGLCSVSLRYFNAAGADTECEIGEYHNPETHIIPRLFDVAVGKEQTFNIFGNNYPTRDGTCVRDYIHVNDLASAHTKSYQYLLKNKGCHYFNLGTSFGYSVLEIIKKVEEITGTNINFDIVDMRPGDAHTLIADPSKAVEKLEWKCKYSNIDRIVEDAWKWYQKKSQ